ncbi:MAG TPA: class I SAM-dependent methyltransferase [Anaeromyxobacteraceae bacterium]
MLKTLRPGTELNWLARYLPFRGALHAPASSSLLEVGCGPVGLGSILDGPFVGVDVAFDLGARPPMIPVQVSPGPLPFSDGAFHTVVSVDALEHIPPASRAAFIGELCRVAASHVLLTFPAGTAGREVDALMGAVLQRLTGTVPEWLSEHEQHGLPEPAEIEALLSGLAGWSWQPFASTSSLGCVLWTLADVVPELRRWAHSVIPQDLEALGRWVDASSEGPSFRSLYLLRRDVPLTSIFDAGAPASLAAALACRACLGRLESGRGSDQLRCHRCGATLARDARGVWRADQEAEPVLVGFRETTFAAEPDWLGDDGWMVAVHNFLESFGPGDPCRLWLRLDRESLSLAEGVSLLAPLTARFGDRPFAEIVLEDEPGASPPGARVVPLSREPELARWTVERFHAAAREEA